MNRERVWVKHVKNERQRRVQEHKPLFFLGEGKGFERIISADQVQNREREVMNFQGRITNKSCITTTLPGGTKVELRSYSSWVPLRWNRGALNALDVTFELAFTLGGPVAYNIT